jgi:hypothetical protein
MNLPRSGRSFHMYLGFLLIDFEKLSQFEWILMHFCGSLDTNLWFFFSCYAELSDSKTICRESCSNVMNFVSAGMDPH